ncbi:formate/nitrite transporter family protein [Acidiferrimicrobium sp. IK]|uniref:formate/nitrite transporter family protein n=1 Tax=Acidiferrimicrobium sp. IK TaxID=2871700 RepID=UPI0021CB6B7A|nr:formate/nitrite transporter family protein [Acidiferrimicrobium sp. IK]MCU4183409.1 formate/nitrite transporter family protein [Acidiferrimicrobium sp. IK]
MTNSPREEALERSFDRIVEDGRPRLRRGATDLLATGATGGIEVAFGVLALLYVEDRTGDPLLGGLAFSIGFIALRLGHSELFTEGFLVPVTVVAAGEARVRDMLRMWVGTLAGNLAGGWLVAWLIDTAFPELRSTANQVAGYYIRAGINARSFALAVLAGAAITLLTRMHNGTDSEPAKLIASVAIGFLLAGTRLFHSVLDSLLAFVALDTGRAPFGYLDWAGWVVWVVVGNVLGGLVLTSALRLVRSRGRLLDHRVANDLDTPGVSVAVGRQRDGVTTDR